MVTLQVQTFSDIFKKSFIEGWQSQTVSLSSVVITLGVTFLIGLYIFFLYRLTTQRTFYSKSFNISIVGVALITSAIIITIQSSIVISLGMVGSLSIVRFRTAIKNPMDLMYLFWAVSIGIICGAGFSIYAVALSVVLTATVLLLQWLPVAKSSMLLIINSSDLTIENQVMNILKKVYNRPVVKAMNYTPTSLDLTIELKVKDGNFLQDVNAIPGVKSVSLISHDGEVTF